MGHIPSGITTKPRTSRRRLEASHEGLVGPSVRPGRMGRRERRVVVVKEVGFAHRVPPARQCRATGGGRSEPASRTGNFTGPRETYTLACCLLTAGGGYSRSGGGWFSFRRRPFFLVPRTLHEKGSGYREAGGTTIRRSARAHRGHKKRTGRVGAEASGPADHDGGRHARHPPGKMSAAALPGRRIPEKDPEAHHGFLPVRWGEGPPGHHDRHRQQFAPVTVVMEVFGQEMAMPVPVRVRRPGTADAAPRQGPVRRHRRRPFPAPRVDLGDDRPGMGAGVFAQIEAEEEPRMVLLERMAMGERQQGHQPEIHGQEPGKHTSHHDRDPVYQTPPLRTNPHGHGRASAFPPRLLEGAGPTASGGQNITSARLVVGPFYLDPQRIPGLRAIALMGMAKPTAFTTKTRSSRNAMGLGRTWVHTRTACGTSFLLRGFRGFVVIPGGSWREWEVPLMEPLWLQMPGSFSPLASRSLPGIASSGSW